MAIAPGKQMGLIKLLWVKPNVCYLLTKHERVI